MKKSKKDIALEMFEYVDANLDHAYKSKLDEVSLREVLIVLADWVYGERTKSETELAKLMDRMSEASKNPSFLDALDEIS